MTNECLMFPVLGKLNRFFREYNVGVNSPQNKYVIVNDIS